MVLPRVPGFTVRPIELADAASWASYVCLPEVRQHTSSTATTVAEIEAEIARTLSQEPNTPIRFVLLPEGSATIVATVGFHTISALFGTAEVTYDVAPSHWGMGIATSACLAATLWGFEVKAWHRVHRQQRCCQTRGLSAFLSVLASSAKGFFATSGSSGARPRTTGYIPRSQAT